MGVHIGGNMRDTDDPSAHGLNGMLEEMAFYVELPSEILVRRK